MQTRLRGWCGDLYSHPHPCSGLYGGLSVFVDRRLRSICYIIVLSVLSISAYPSSAASPSPAPEQATVASKALRLSVNEALALFSVKTWMCSSPSTGSSTARASKSPRALFPNPVATIGTVASFTQGRHPSNSGQLFGQIQQLFELAGKRGYRIESAGFGSQSAEAAFEDAVRQLGFTVKDAYYRMQLAQRRLALGRRESGPLRAYS